MSHTIVLKSKQIAGYINTLGYSDKKLSTYLKKGTVIEVCSEELEYTGKATVIKLHNTHVFSRTKI